LLRIGALVLADVPLTSFYQDEIEPVFEDFRLPTACCANTSPRKPTCLYILKAIWIRLQIA